MATTRRKKAPKKTAANKVVEGVRLAKADEALVRTSYRQAVAAAGSMGEPPMELPAEDTLDFAGLVENLVLWYRVSTPVEDLCDCTTCGGDSDARLDACPYCGDGDVEDGDEDAQDGADEETAHDVRSEEEDAPAPAPAPAKGRKKAAKKGKPAEPAETTEVVVAEEVEVEVIDKGAYTVQDLDDAVMSVNELKAKAAQSVWDLGVEISKIHERSLWRHRLDEARKTAYKSFGQFCTTELGMSFTHAKRLIAVAQAFDKETMNRIGVGKCNILLSLPKDVRDTLADGAENKSSSQLSDEARALKGGEEPQVPRGALTVAMAPGQVEIPLMARPKNNARKNSDKPAKTMGDDPWAREQLPNRVHVYYSLTKNKAGELVLLIERRRVSKDEVFHDEVEGE